MIDNFQGKRITYKGKQLKMIKVPENLLNKKKC